MTFSMDSRQISRFYGLNYGSIKNLRFLDFVTYVRFMTKLNAFEDLPNYFLRLWFGHTLLVPFKLI